MRLSPVPSDCCYFDWLVALLAPVVIALCFTFPKLAVLKTPAVNKECIWKITRACW